MDLVVPCPTCRTLNRLPDSRVADRPVCSSCRAPLFGGPVALDQAAFDRVAGKVTLPMVVDFWAEWCGPCKMMAPWFDAASKQLAGTFVFGKVDTEAEPALAARFEIRSIPTLVVFEQGAERRRTSGAMRTEQLVQWLQQG